MLMKCTKIVFVIVPKNIVDSPKNLNKAIFKFNSALRKTKHSIILHS